MCSFNANNLFLKPILKLRSVNIYLNAIKASPISPPTMWTPPSGIERPLKNWRISKAFADHGKFCKRIITLIFYLSEYSTQLLFILLQVQNIHLANSHTIAIRVVYLNMYVCKMSINPVRLVVQMTQTLKNTINIQVNIKITSFLNATSFHKVVSNTYSLGHINSTNANQILLLIS